MKTRLKMVMALLPALVACAGTPKSSDGMRAPAAQESPPRTLMKASDPSLRAGDLTVWTLQKMAQDKKFDELNALFNNGVSLDSLPSGYAAGAAARVLGLPGEAGMVLDMFTGDNWRGKIFCQGEPAASHGLNRIRRNLIDFKGKSPITPTAKFTTFLIDRHPLVPEATSNLVVLNYAHPASHGEHEGDPYVQEVLLDHAVHVYDVVAAVKGKYGPVYIGKTWIGSYDKNDEFKPWPHLEKTLVAWFFLDFNPGALAEQKASHWPKGQTEASLDARNSCPGMRVP